MNQLLKSYSLLAKRSLPVLTGLSLLTTVGTPIAKAELTDSPKAIIDEVWQIVNSEFVDRNFNNIDWLKTRQELLSRKYTSKKEAYQAISEALKQFKDPYTRFLEPEAFADLTSQTSGELSGVGIQLTLDMKTNQLKVAEPIPNSPAIKAGVKPGDTILKINNKPTSLMSLEQAAAEIRGETGTNVVLQLSRMGKGTFEVSLIRAQIELPTVTYDIKQEKGLKVGYIKLDEFSSHAAEQMKKAIEELKQKQVGGYVLDLRGNPGGLLFASVDIARMWMPKGDIVRTVDRKGGDRTFSANGTAITDSPLVVLVDEGSASASEILTGALKDNQRATIVGTRTFGKGLVQSVHSLSDGSGIAVTIARYYPPSGIDINHKGIQPDITQQLTKEQEELLRINPKLIATNNDPQYSQAIHILEKLKLSKQNSVKNSVSIR